jgi:serine/threonine protein kinase
MKYPLRGDYDTVVRNLDKFVDDDTLKQGKPVMQKHNPHLLLSYNGGKAIVYEIQTKDKIYALKCWVEDLGNLKVHYKAIDEYLKKVNLPYFVDFSYQEKGILVNGIKYPIICMEWVEAISFKTFIGNNIHNPACLRNLAENFLKMAETLHKNNISHGDLQHGNILIRKDNNNICLIDYDSLFVPELRNENDHIKGLPGYQHPHRNKLVKLNVKSDYFSELIIYLSLIILSEKPHYWDKIAQEETLIFSSKDIENPRQSNIFNEIKNISEEIKYLTEKLESFCQESNIENLLSLEKVVSGYNGKKSSWDDFIPPVVVNQTQPNSPSSSSKNQRNTTYNIFNKPSTKIKTKSKNSKTSSGVNNFENTFSPSQNTKDNDWEDTFTSTPIVDNNLDTLNQSKPMENQTIGLDNEMNDNWWNDKYENKFSNSTQPIKKTNNNDSMWDKFTKSVSSIWDNIAKFFNLFKN